MQGVQFGSATLQPIRFGKMPQAIQQVPKWGWSVMALALFTGAGLGHSLNQINSLQMAHRNHRSDTFERSTKQPHPEASPKGPFAHLLPIQK